MRWEKKYIREIGLIKSGGTPSTKKTEYWNGDTPWITPKDLSGFQFRYIDKGERNISEEGLIKSSAKLIPEKSILLTSRAPIGYLAISNTNVTTNQGFKNIILFKEFHYLFIYYCLKNNIEYLKSLGTGSTYPELSAARLKDVIIKIPPLETQQKIASILSAYDDLIENNLRRIKLLEEKVALEYKILIKNNQSTLRKKPIHELGNVTSSKRIYLSEYVEDGIPFYRSKEIISKATFENISNPLFISEAKYYDIKTKFGVPKSGDILITSVGTIGFIHLVNDNDGDFYFKDGNLIWIRNLSDTQLQYYLYFKFRTQEFRNMINSIAIGSSQKALTIETVKKIEIELPEEKNLFDFNISAKVVLNLIYNLQNQNTKLREARDILLPRLMSGEIEV